MTFATGSSIITHAGKVRALLRSVTPPREAVWNDPATVVRLWWCPAALLEVRPGDTIVTVPMLDGMAIEAVQRGGGS